jgi:hypothetical protein
MGALFRGLAVAIRPANPNRGAIAHDVEWVMVFKLLTGNSS